MKSRGVFFNTVQNIEVDLGGVSYVGCSFSIHVHQSPDELPIPVIRKRMSMG